MAPPTITQILPGSGHPAGGYLLAIHGTGFVVPTFDPAPDELPMEAADPTVSVTVNGRSATQVEVWTEELVTCICPAFRGDPNDLSASPGLAVDVVVTNLPADSTTINDGFYYARTNLTKTEGVLYTIIRTMVLEMRRQIINNIAVNTHVDYDGDTSDGLDIVEHAEMPGIALFGPDIVDDPIFQEHGRNTQQYPDTQEFYQVREPSVVSLSFEAALVANTLTEALQLASEFVLFFTRTKHIWVNSEDTDPTSEEVGFPIMLTSQPTRRGTANSAGTVTLAASFVIQHVMIDADDLIRVSYGHIMGDPEDVRVIPLEQTI